jgi:hypothetical protein
MRNIVSLRILLFAGLASTLASILPTPVQAGSTVSWVSGTGSDNNTVSLCQRLAPCQTLRAALTVTLPGGTIFCADPGVTIGGTPSLTISSDVTIDCSEGVHAVVGSLGGGAPIVISTAGINVTIRNLAVYAVDIPDSPNPIGIDITAAAVVRLENCKIFGFSGPGVEVAPSSGNAVVKIQDSAITRNTAGVLVAPTGSGSASISIDRSRIENNNGGGMKTDTTSGAINATISDSSVSFNAGNGVNAVGGSGAQNMLYIRNSVIASNGNAGIQANGTNAAALVNGSVLDSNTAGATAVIGGGRILTYGNNSIIGPVGSNFTGTTPLQ